MRNPLLAALGVQHYPAVLARSVVGPLTEAMMAAEGSASSVYNPAGDVGVIDGSRRSLSLHLDAELREEVTQQLRVLDDFIRRDFGESLEAPEQFEFLRYGPGDRFVAHSDVPAYELSAEADPMLKRRRVSAVVFVNGHEDPAAPGTYSGGRLLFQAFDDPDDTFAARGFGIDQLPGDAVAFPATLCHEVAPVVDGTRLTVVGWYLEPADEESDSSEVATAAGAAPAEPSSPL